MKQLLVGNNRIQDHQFRMLRLKEHRFSVTSFRSVLKKVLRTSRSYLFRFGKRFYPCLYKCRRAFVAFPQDVIAAVSGGGQRVNCGRVSIVKPKENRAFKLALCDRFNRREQLSYWRSRVSLGLWGAHWRALLRILLKIVATGLCCGFTNGSNFPQFPLDGSGVKSASIRNQFSNEQHVDNKRVETGNVPLGLRNVCKVVSVGNFLLPDFYGCFDGELSKLTPVVIAAIYESQNPGGKTGDNETGQRNQSADNLRVREYVRHMWEGALAVHACAFVLLAGFIGIRLYQSRLR